MKTEFVLLGKHINMASRRRRRWLVALVYAGLTTFMTGCWFFDHWQGFSVVYLYIAANLANSLFFGGIGFGGLVRPFINKRTFQMPAPAVRLLRWGLRPAPKWAASDYQNDERELHERDHAHYQAYRVMIAGLSIIWIVSTGVLPWPGMWTQSLIPLNLVLYGLVMATLVISLTLPQAILLWTEPDMEEPQKSS